ncbi:hypothetical protein Sgly_0895 [Syntrophobotulus glycolicus DSM 8271]|uniref:Uncharacterized protein n=1 Tax=Syntrophobotulus glycolicus (strain DSM 8271 / FlGlyR) TaxID=645991 RepID=F0T1X7_SYNGF|nr:hypothetical protein [Syntrophobotulus glycolicus]ADY55241.1 hypothetical protein Sgly_0895 [Syntrophobotulus glycolicus DSM 8271]
MKTYDRRFKAEAVRLIKIKRQSQLWFLIGFHQIRLTGIIKKIRDIDIQYVGEFGQ